MPQRRYRAAAAVADGRLYICGGSEGGRHSAALNSVIRFDPSAMAWEALPPMIEKRSGSSAVVANKNIYVGHCGRTDAPAHPTRGLLGGRGGSLWYESSGDFGCNGGSPGESPFALVSGERFSTETSRWSRCPPSLLSTPGACAAAVMSSCLYTCGGSAQGPSMRSDVSRIVGTELGPTEAAPWLRQDSAAAVPSVPAGRALRRNWTT